LAGPALPDAKDEKRVELLREHLTANELLQSLEFLLVGIAVHTTTSALWPRKSVRRIAASENLPLPGSWQSPLTASRDAI
jgi:hypothetical protein